MPEENNTNDETTQSNVDNATQEEKQTASDINVNIQKQLSDVENKIKSYEGDNGLVQKAEQELNTATNNYNTAAEALKTAKEEYNSVTTEEEKAKAKEKVDTSQTAFDKDKSDKEEKENTLTTTKSELQQLKQTQQQLTSSSENEQQKEEPEAEEITKEREAQAANAQTLQQMYESIKDAKCTEDNEITNILTNYYWTINKIPQGSSSSSSSSGSAKLSNGKIPFAYITEIQQLYSSQITNVINSIMSLSTAKAKFADVANNVTNQAIQNIVNKVKESALYDTSKMSESTSFLNSIASKLSSYYQYSNIQGNTLLRPYLYLYATKPTGSYYVFPILTDDSSAWKISNTFTDSQGGTNKSTNLLNNNLTSALSEFPAAVSTFLNDAVQLTDMIGGTQDGSVFVNNWVEMGKFFNYPTEGDTLSIKFPLFNTVEKGGWKKNHRFIFLFALKNMPFKIDNSSYKMPLLYDIDIPGVKRMPFAFVKSLSIEPRGIIRPLQGDNYLKSIVNSSTDSTNSTMVYNVPEVWNVSIEFQDLIGPSANKILSAIDTKITASSTTSS